MTNRWNIIYRGPLSSCNYSCGYCPFAKTKNTKAELADDAEKLSRFVDWVARQTDREIGILFTPWGEALIHRYYQEAIRRLSHLSNVYRVAIQTNLSVQVDFMGECDLNTAALWTTYHPTQVSFDKFLSRCKELDKMGARYSVGVVGFTDAEEDIKKLRNTLSPNTYIWINAYKRDPDYYTEEAIQIFEKVDPHFRTNTVYHPSKGKPCRAGKSSFTIDGEGDVRRCHFVDEPSLGNIYQDGELLASKLSSRACSIDRCGCHIGYVNLDSLGLDQVYGDGILERIPTSF